MILPMLANPLEIGEKPNQWKRIEEEGYWMEPKLDGWRIMIHFIDGLGKIKAWTRTGRDVTDRLPQGWRDVVGSMPYDTIVDCEFGYESAVGWPGWPMLDFNTTARVMGSNAQVAQAKARELGALPRAFVFDVVQSRGRDLLGLYDNRQRRTFIDDNIGIEGVMVKMPVSRYGWNPAGYSSYVSNGGEGVMLKNPEAQYQPGKRPTQTWYKIKKFDTMDVVITGYQMGQGKFAGKIGAITFVNPVTGITGACSGMSDFDRDSFTMFAETLVGRRMEVRYFGLTASTPRHPQFVRMHLDR